MEMNRSFAPALIFSLVFHLALLINWPLCGHPNADKNKFKDKIEVTYFKINNLKMELPLKKPEIAVEKSNAQPESSQPLKMVEKKTPLNSELRKSEEVLRKPEAIVSSRENSKKTAPSARSSPKAEPIMASKQPESDKSETRTSVDMGDVHSVPASYAQTVRARIINRLNSSDTKGEGDVLVRFVIGSDGKLIQLNIVNEKSSQAGLLRNRAFEAVKDSSPFPNFPRDVAVKEIVFTCLISFRNK